MTTEPVAAEPAEPAEVPEILPIWAVITHGAGVRAIRAASISKTDMEAVWHFMRDRYPETQPKLYCCTNSKAAVAFSEIVLGDIEEAFAHYTLASD